MKERMFSDRDSLLNAYKELNNLSDRTLIFRLGDGAGFFSEYNCMILAMLYCLTHRIRFVLHSYKGNFAREKGWDDFFLPFCITTKEKSAFTYIHTCANFRPYGSQEKIQLRNGTWKWYLKKRALNILAQGYKFMFLPRTYLTQDLWNQFFYPQPYYDIPELNIHGDIAEACHRLVQLTWHFNEETTQKIQSLKSKLKLPKEYISCHLRQGDKCVEAHLLTIDPYIEHITRQSCKDIFVSSDDYMMIEQLKARCPEYNWYTLSEETDRGYSQQEFERSTPSSKFQALIKLWASVDVMIDSQRFIGTTTSNLGVFMNICRPDISESVDSDKNMLYNILRCS